MKAKLNRNIDILQVNIQDGVLEYNFPKNVAWAAKKIDSLVLFSAAEDMVSPVDGQTHVLTADECENLYVDLYAANDAVICQNLHYSNLLHTNNHPVVCDSQLSLQLSRIYFTTEPAATGCLLFYVIYDQRVDEDFELPRRSITIDFELGASERKSLCEAISTTLYADYERVRGIEVWNADENPAYLTLRDHAMTYQVNSLYTGMARPLMAGQTAELQQVHPLLLDCLDIDFENSFVQNATDEDERITITILY